MSGHTPSEPVAWMLERDQDPTFPRVYPRKNDALAMKNFVNVGPLPTITPLYSHAANEAKIEALASALQRICEIENQEFGNDWEEIEQARSIARAALTSAGEK